MGSFRIQNIGTLPTCCRTSAKGGITQIRAQISAVEGQNVSQVGETLAGKVTSKSLVDNGISRLESGVVAVGRMVRAAGFEPATPSV